MKVLIVFAHPELRSLNGSLKTAAVQYLQEAGHEVAVSDLYRQQWKSAADGYDFQHFDPAARLYYNHASKKAFLEGAQTIDISTEQEKVRWADVVIFQFPLWWFGMPAILKGWVDRVFTNGFGYGTGQRYGHGALEGKRAMLIITAGAAPEQFLETGINGSINDLLFPIHHGIFWYTGMSALPPFVVYNANHIAETEVDALLPSLKDRLLSLDSTAPIPFRYFSKDYDEAGVLKDHFQGDKKGFALHLH
ncbi:NAD(P)H-dependent oxidoreductase [Chitinophaga vietnamensis]|uniref:NAD(P)H-dependent oxidoreductase n=1 Tax=Chitinophaga vietnamensis TaxID=2593957 RepID=UPI0011779F19|nr:NAD(P)H-dependent oxidoreductase [Chitinophaga vietnamensis]